MVSWRLIAVGVAIVVGVFALGYFVGNAGEDEPQPAAVSEDGGGKCGKALAAASDLVELQRQALANRTEFTQAALTGDEGAMADLNEALVPLSTQIEEAQTRMNEALDKCRQRGGGKGQDGNGGGGGGDGGGGGGG